MNPENEQALAALLQEALKSVSITRATSEKLSPAAYRQSVLRYRNVYDPNLRMVIFTHDIHIGDSGVREAILGLLRMELEQFLQEDRTYAATYAIFGGMGSGSTLQEILENLVKAAIVHEPKAAAKAFYDELASGCLPYREYFLLTGIRVENEIQVWDGISLIPLPNSTQNLPGFLSDLSRIDPTEFLSKTLLRVDMSVSPLLHKQEGDYTIQSGPDEHFTTAVHSTDAPDFDIGKFFLALTLVSEHPVLAAIRWTYLSDEHTFDLRIGPGSGYVASSMEASSAVVSETQVSEAVDLYFKIAALPTGVYDQLRIPIDRWVKSKSHQGHVDKMIDLGIAMESFYLRGIRDELSFRFRLRASLYLGDGIEQRRRLKTQFRQIYQIRSAAVHEGTLPSHVKVEGNDVRIREFIERSQDLFKRSLLKVIEIGQLPDWDSIELGGSEQTDDKYDNQLESPAMVNRHD